MDVGDYFIVTGGATDRGSHKDASNETELYSQSGFVRYLADMHHRRSSHGCTKFLTDNGDPVKEDAAIFSFSMQNFRPFSLLAVVVC